MGHVVTRIVGWIPGDVIAIYGTAITALNSSPSRALLFITAGVAGLVTLLSAFSASGRAPNRLVVLNAGMAVVGFLIWSLAVPDSGWLAWGTLASHTGWLAIAAGFGGLLGSLFFTGVDKRAQNRGWGAAGPA